MAESVFTRIIRGEIPSHRVYEDHHVFAFLDIGPLSDGHTLVVPKEETAKIGDLSDESSAAIGRVLPRLCRAVAEATGTEDCNVLLNNGEAAGQEVPHVHFHIIPRHADGSGLAKRWQAGSLDPDRGNALAEKIASLVRP